MKIQHALAHELASLLLKLKLKVVTAESCTGGLLASLLTDIPGSSHWFERGLITYSNAAKMDLLGVPEAFLRQYGAVSCEVAGAMATGALHASPADLAIAITGIAGPSGGTKSKPVGTVCFGWAYQDEVVTTQVLFPATDRQRIRLLACCEALKGANTFLRP